MQQNKKNDIMSFELSDTQYRRLGMQKRKEGKLDAAMLYLWQAEEKNPCPENCLAVAKTLAMAERYSDAVAYLYSAFPDIDTRPSEMYLYLAANYTALDEPLQARIVLSQYVLTCDDDSVQNVYPMFSELLRNRDMLTVIPRCEPATEREIYLIVTGRRPHSLSYGEYETAIEINLHYLELYPDNQFVMAELAYLYLLTNNIKKAFELIDKLDLGAVEVDIDFMCLYVVAMGLSGKPSDVALELTRLSEISPNQIDDENTLSRLVSTFLMFGEYEKALPFAKRLHSMLPYVTEVNHKYALCCYAMGDYQTAFDCYYTILRFAPDDFIAANHRNLCKNALNDAAAGKKVVFDKAKPPLGNYYFVDTQTMIEMFKAVNEIMNLEMYKAIARFDDISDPMYNLFLDVLCSTDESQKHVIIDYLCKFPTDTLISFLRDYLLCPDEDSYQAKNMALIQLMRIDEAPYAAAFGNRVIEGFPNGDILIDGTLSETARKIKNNCMLTTRKQYKALCAMAASELLTYYFCADADVPEVDDTLAVGIAAAITYRACARCNITESPESVCGVYGITMTDLEHGASYLKDLESLYLE